jgi:Transposase family tnp2
LLCIVAAFYFRHPGTTFAALSDILDLLNLIVPGCIVRSLYHFKKIFFSDKHVVEMHFYCPSCESYLGTKKKRFVCSTCRHPVRQEDCMKSQSFFLTSPISNQLKEILEQTNVFEEIKRSKVLSKSNAEGRRGEIVTGDGYRDRRLKHFLEVEENFSLTFSTDGIQVFNSSKDSLWPIMCSFNEVNFKVKSKHVVLQGLWFGKKPKQETFLRPFVKEARKLYSKGFKWTDSTGDIRNSRVLFLIGVLDSPARAAFTCRRQWNGKCGCGWCYHPGKTTFTYDSKGRRKGSTRTYPVSYPLPKLRKASEVLKDARLVSNSKKPHVNGVTGMSYLHYLPFFDVVFGMIPDSMHCVYLGVTKMFLEMWTSISRQQYSIKSSTIDNLMLNVKAPSELSRTYRSLVKCFSDWKASEFRNFLLIYSAPILKNVLPDRFYKHWLLLVNYMRILTKKTITDEDLTICKKLAIRFTHMIPHLYGPKYVRSNVHLLQHIVDSTKLWGAPWASSAFLFESLGGLLGKFFKGSNRISKQIFSNFLSHKHLRRISSLHMSSANEKVKKVYRKLDPNNFGNTGQFELLGKGTVNNLNHETLCNIAEIVGDSVCNFAFKYRRCRFKTIDFSTEEYSSKFKRDNSVFELNDGRIVRIESIYILGKCRCESGNCHKTKFNITEGRVLFLTRELKSSQISCIDDQLQFELLSFMRKVEIVPSAPPTLIEPNLIAKKCILFPIADEIYSVGIDNILEGN